MMPCDSGIRMIRAGPRTGVVSPELSPCLRLLFNDLLILLISFMVGVLCGNVRIMLRLEVALQQAMCAR